MTVYVLPPEPEGPIWLGDHPDLGPGPHQMWKYLSGWGFGEVEEARFTWAAVLAMGEVYDHHPANGDAMDAPRTTYPRSLLLAMWAVTLALSLFLYAAGAFDDYRPNGWLLVVFGLIWGVPIGVTAVLVGFRARRPRA